jgi:N-acetylglucosamine malate deacetylase 1
MRVLVVAPHADDETLGAGGAIARHAREGDEVTVAVMTGPGEGRHPVFPNELWDTVRDEAEEAAAVLGVKDLVFRELPAVLVPDRPVWEVNGVAAEVLEQAAPEILYVPFPFDLHRDHREISYAFSVAWRPTTELGRRIRLIYAYETLSETHWNPAYLEAGFTPNTYVDISGELDVKLDALRCYRSQMLPFPHARSLEAIEHQARWRGAQVGMEAAEAFVTIRSLHPASGRVMSHR